MRALASIKISRLGQIFCNYEENIKKPRPLLQYQDNIRTISRQYQGQYQDNIRTISRQYQDNIKTISGQYQDNIRTISRQYQDNIRIISGYQDRWTPCYRFQIKDSTPASVYRLFLPRKFFRIKAVQFHPFPTTNILCKKYSL